MPIHGCLAVAAAVAFLVLALLAHRGAVLLPMDRHITRAVQSIHSPLYNWVLTHASDLGFVPLNFVSYAVVFMGLAAGSMEQEAMLAVASSMLAGVVAGAIKLIVARARPSGSGITLAGHLSGYSFPSGHVTEYTTLFGFAFYAILVSGRGGMVRRFTLGMLALLVLLVGPSRVYLGEHWASDVLGAYLFAGLWLAGTIALHLRLQSREEHPAIVRRR